MARTPAPPERRLYDYADRSASIAYVMDKLSSLDAGKYVELDIVSSEDVTRFCKLIGFKQTWAGKTIDEICARASKKDRSYGPNVIAADEARIILEILQTMIGQGRFKSREDEKFDKTILNDFIDRDEKGFAGSPTLGHCWEFQYALQVELEHGRTRGTNVTNNHPLLTALVVMAHLAEDTCYYARLWVMETEGEITKAVHEDEDDEEIAEKTREWVIAKAYFARRMAEKANVEGVALPD